MEGAKRFPLDELSKDSKTDLEKISMLNEFKGHVKKELVNYESISLYFRSLIEFLTKDNQNAKLILLTHSSLCYLIKRIAMQSSKEFSGDLIEKLLIALMKNFNKDKKNYSSAIKSLEAIYLCNPIDFEAKLIKLCENENPLRTKILLFIDELINLHRMNSRNPMELVNKFLNCWVKILNNNNTNQKDIELIYEILKKYRNEPSLLNLFKLIKNPDVRSLFMFTSNPSTPDMPVNQEFDVDIELNKIMNETSSGLSNTLSNVGSKDYLSSDMILKDLEQIIIPFHSSRETEHNWKPRQENIIKLRKMIHGNIPKQFPRDFINGCKEFGVFECISKAAISLRTTLSSNACCLIKEFAVNFGTDLDPLTEMLFSAPKSLLSATKKITSQIAYTTTICLLCNFSYNTRVFQQCLMISRDKNISPRCFATIFLRIFIVRFHKRLENSLILVEEWLRRGLSDAQTTVRESMRVTFWYWYKVQSLSAKKVLDSLSPQLRKAVELSIPEHLDIDYRISLNPSISNNSSNRSSLTFRKFPSYAAPTHSSYSQKLSLKTRSTSELISNTYHEKNLGTRSSSSLSEVHPNSNITEAPHIELTEEISENHLNPLINKYLPLNPDMSESSNEHENLYSYLSSSSISSRKEGIQILQNLLLMNVTLDTDRLLPLLRQLLLKSPKSFQPILSTPGFSNILSIPYLIEIYALNEFDITNILEKFDHVEILSFIISMFSNFYPDDTELSIYYVRYRYTIFNYCFDLILWIITKNLDLPIDSLRKCISELIHICGNEFDNSRYYNLLYMLYLRSSNVFIEILRSSLASNKLKIANELQQRDTNFQIQSILSHEPIKVSIDEDKKVVEMTMVNPWQNSNSNPNFEEQASNASRNSSVIHNSLVENIVDDDDGFTKFGGLSKLTEMTKVISIYQGDKEFDKYDQVEDQKQVLSHPESSLDLQMIFDSGKRQHECSENIQIANSQNQFNTSELSYNDNNILVCNSQNAQELKSKPFTSPIPSSHILQEPKKLVNELSDFDIKKNDAKTNNSISQSESDTPLNQNIKIDSIVSEINILSTVPVNSLIRFELEVIERTEKSTDTYIHIKEFINSIDAIKDKALTALEIEKLLFILLQIDHSQDINKWIQNKTVFGHLWSIGYSFLDSTIHANHLPIDSIYRSIIIITCLVIIDYKLDKKYLSSEEINQVWSTIIKIINRLTDYQNVIFISFSEFRDFLFTNFPHHLSLLLENCLMELNQIDRIEYVKITFLLASVHLILTCVGDILALDVLQMLATFTRTFFKDEIVEWRHEANLILLQIYKILAFRDVPDEFIYSILPSSILASD